MDIRPFTDVWDFQRPNRFTIPGKRPGFLCRGGDGHLLAFVYHFPSKLNFHLVSLSSPLA
jgi:hypothetical protein